MIEMTDAIVHLLLVAFSGIVVCISPLAYADRRSPRYLYLSLAFVFLAASEAVGLFEVMFLSTQLIVIPFSGVHLSHFLDFLMLSSFGLASLMKNEGVGNGDRV